MGPGQRAIEAQDCGRCDTCRLRAAGKLQERKPPRSGARRRTAQALAAVEAREPRVHPGERVRHRTFGQGEVVEAGEDDVTVRFARVGEKRLPEGSLEPA